MKIDLEGEVNKRIEEISHQVKSRATRASNELRVSALNVLSNRKKRSGKEYRKPFTKNITYTASAPGEPPALRTGNLRVSWRSMAVSERMDKDLTVRPAITTDVKYAPWLDEGTDTIVPRPIEKPIIEDAIPRIRKIFEEPY